MFVKWSPNEQVNINSVMEAELEEIKKRGIIPTLLLHSCCAPCSSHCISILSDYFKITVFYYNPNIEPQDEYEKRKEEQKRFIKEFPAANPVDFLDCDYDNGLFHEVTEKLTEEPEGGARCTECFLLRLSETAEAAKENGFDYFATTLTVSPYKNSKLLNEIGYVCSEKYGVDFLPTDFKKKNGYRHSIELSEEYGLYRQDYCGCIYSKRDRDRKKALAEGKMHDGALIEVINATKRYGTSFVAADHLNFSVKGGEIVGFVGENGAGKTTTLKMLSGILKPDDGCVYIDGNDIVVDSVKAKKSLAYVADSPDMFLRLKGIEYLNLMADIYGVSYDDRVMRIDELAGTFGIKDVLGESISSLSHGMRQKLMISAALLHEPPVWILDEPMTGLDPYAAHELKELMRSHAAKGNCVFFSTHVLEVAAGICDRIVIIKKGHIIFNDSLEKLEDNFPGKTLEEIFLEYVRDN